MRASIRVGNRDAKNNIIYLEDWSNQTGSISITNDAENIVDYYRSVYGNRVRVVYLDTNKEWWEIKWTIDLNGTHVNFKQWHGLAWDKLSRVES